MPALVACVGHWPRYSIVKAAGQNANSVWQYLVDQTVFLIDAPRPTPRKLVFKRFRFADSGKWIALGISRQPYDPDGLASIPLSPPREILEGGGIELDTPQRPSFATASSSGTPLCRWRAACSRFRMVSDFKR